MKPHTTPPIPVLSDAQIDAALSSAEDLILPSSGFAGSVMAAVTAAATAPAPIPFPWKRALPGMIIGGAALLAVLGLFVYALVTRAMSPVGAAPGGGVLLGSFDVAGLLHRAASPAILWTAFACALPLLCLVFLRRVVFSR